MTTKKSQKRRKQTAGAAVGNANGSSQRRPAHQTLKPVLPPGSAVHALYFEPGSDPDAVAENGGEWYPGRVAGCSVHDAL